MPSGIIKPGATPVLLVYMVCSENVKLARQQFGSLMEQSISIVVRLRSLTFTRNARIVRSQQIQVNEVWYWMAFKEGTITQY